MQERAHLKDALRVKAHYHQAWYSSALCALKLGDDDALAKQNAARVARTGRNTQKSSAAGLGAHSPLRECELLAAGIRYQPLNDR